MYELELSFSNIKLSQRREQRGKEGQSRAIKYSIVIVSTRCLFVVSVTTLNMAFIPCNIIVKLHVLNRFHKHTDDGNNNHVY